MYGYGSQSGMGDDAANVGVTIDAQGNPYPGYVIGGNIDAQGNLYSAAALAWQPPAAVSSWLSSPTNMLIAGGASLFVLLIMMGSGGRNR